VQESIGALACPKAVEFALRFERPEPRALALLDSSSGLTRRASPPECCVVRP
jgi:hypothetical protein